jgi:hypothetical protein|tara:strand:+ start:447 stop:743 length:297 start_codon:yes stop_codon:yes gene_type:complete
MKYLKWGCVGLFVLALLAYTSTANANKKTDDLLKAIVIYKIATEIDKKQPFKGKEPPCARAGAKWVPGVLPGERGRVIRYPVCPNIMMPYGGLIKVKK